MRLTLIILCFLGVSCSTLQERPNFIFIFSDDHATSAISAYGGDRIETPHLDQLAAEGILFENCFCTNAICAPSRAVVLTGKYSHANGVLDNSAPFDGSQQTFPKLLQEAGYRTALIGKWHLKSEPTGFDYWEVLPGQGDYFDPLFIRMGEQIKKEGYVTDILTAEAELFLRTYNYNKPFCLMLQHKAPHADWEWPETLADAFSVDFELPVTFYDDYSSRGPALAHSILKVDSAQWKLHYEERFGTYPYNSPEEMYQRYMNDYLRCIRGIDNSMGRIMACLEEEELDQNTIVIYSSDQGFFLGEHGLYDKRFMYEESLRMPLIIRGSGRFLGLGLKASGLWNGVRKEEIVLNADFAPTILDLAGISIPGEMHGRSFAPLLKGLPIPDWRNSMYYRFYEQAYWIGPHEGIRTHTHKLIHFEYPEEAWELFDLQADPNELNNLYYEDRYADLIDSLKTAMSIYRVNIGIQ